MHDYFQHVTNILALKSIVLVVNILADVDYIRCVDVIYILHIFRKKRQCIFSNILFLQMDKTISEFISRLVI